MGYFGIPFRNGVPIGLGSIVGFGAPQEFSPSELFLGGTAGAWYDPSDLSTMFTTSAGTTPVAMPGQGSAVSVGLLLDKSQGLVLGSELVSGTWANGTSFPFDTFTASGTGFTGNKTAFGISQAVLPAGASITSGALYRVELRITFADDDEITVNFQTSSGGGGVASSSAFSFGNISSTTTIVGYVRGTSTGTAYLQMSQQGTNRTLTVASVSVRAVPGNHAISFNDTTARPELRARVNLLVATATLSTQNVTTQATSYTLRFAGTGSITLSGTATGSYSAGTHTITCTAGTLTLTVSGAVTTADLRPANSGALLPAYQAVVDANTYDTSGFPLYLRFDGIDDSMYTPANLNLSGTDKVAVFAGVRRLAEAFYPMVVESGATGWDVNNGAFGISGGDPSGEWRFGVRGAGGAGGTVYYDPVTYTPPITNVLSMQADLSGSTKATTIIPRVNGVLEQEGGAGTTSGGGNFGSYPLFIGARNNSSLFLNGHLHSLIIAGSAVSASNISATEQWVAGKTGIVIP